MANANLPQNFNLILPAGTQIVTKIEVKILQLTNLGNRD